MYYQRHAFFCTNVREGRACCQDHGAEQARAHAKARVTAAGVSHPGGIRVNRSGCLDRCEEGPVVVVYPEGTWYTYADLADVDEIVDEHLVHGRVVKRLQI